MKLKDISFVEGEVVAILHGLLSQLDAGVIDKKGIEFHALCLNKLDKLKTSQKHISLSLFFLYGCMYNITDRCSHRFIRAQQ